MQLKRTNLKNFHSHIWFKFRHQVYKIQLLKSLLLMVASIGFIATHQSIKFIGNFESKLFFFNSSAFVLVCLAIIISPHLFRKQFKNSNILLFTILELVLYFSDYLLAYLKFPIEDFTYFRIAAREVPIVSIMGYIASKTIFQRVSADNIHSPLAELRSEIYRLVFRFFPFATILVLISHHLLQSTADYNFNLIATTINYSTLILLASILQPEFLLLHFKCNKAYFLGKIIQLVLNLVLAIVFSSIIGVAGIIIGTAVAVLIGKLYFIFVVKNKLKIGLNEYFPVSQYLIFSIIFIIAFVLTEII